MKGKTMKKLVLVLGMLAICGAAFADIVVKEYFRPDCPHCKKMFPIVDQFQKEFPTVEVKKINITENQALAQQDGVLSVPTFIVYEKGKEIGAFTGSREYDDFVRSVINPPKRKKKPVDIVPILVCAQIGMQFVSMVALLFIALKVGRA